MKKMVILKKVLMWTPRKCFLLYYIWVCSSWYSPFLSHLPPVNVLPGIAKKLVPFLLCTTTVTTECSISLGPQTISSYLLCSVCHWTLRRRSLNLLCKIFPNITLALCTLKTYGFFLCFCLRFYFLLTQVLVIKPFFCDFTLKFINLRLWFIIH